MQTPQSPRPANGRKTRRYLAGGALLSGGLVLGALFSPIGLAGAQEDGTTTAETTTADAATSSDSSSDNGSERDGRGHHRRHHRNEEFSNLTGLTIAELREGRDAGQTLAETIEANGGDVDAVATAMETAATEHLEAAVESGRLTQDEADEKLAELPDRIDERLNAEPGEGKARGHHRRHHRNEEFSNLTGLTIAELREGRDAGQTLAETIEANGGDVDAVATAMETAATEHLEAAVESGRLTQDEADEKLAELPDRIDERLNAEPGEGKGPGHRHGHGPDDDSAGETEDTVNT